MEQFKKDKKYYKRAISIAWPSVLESFFIAFAGMIDSMMVAGLGSYAIAAVGLTTQPKFIFLAVFFAINTSQSALVARRKGADDKKSANEIFLTAFTTAMILAVITTSVSLYFIDDIIRISGSNADTHSGATTYFFIIQAGMIFNVIAMVINSAQRGIGNTKIAFTTNLVSSIVNITFNYALINGKFGLPQLGLKGAAIATVLGSMVAACMSIYSLFSKQNFINIHYIIRKKIKPHLAPLRSIFDIGSTIFVENIAMRIGFVATALTAAGLGTDPFAAYNAGMNLLGLTFSFADGMQVAAVALTGNALGKGDKEQALKYGHVSQRIGLAISIFLSIFLLVFGKNIMQLYFNQEHIIEMGVMITRFIVVIAILQISQIIFGACLRAGGDIKFTLFASLLSITIIRTTVTLVLVHVFDLGLVGVWLGILSDQLTRFTLLRFRFKTGKWLDIKI